MNDNENIRARLRRAIEVIKREAERAPPPPGIVAAHGSDLIRVLKANDMDYEGIDPEKGYWITEDGIEEM